MKKFRQSGGARPGPFTFLKQLFHPRATSVLLMVEVHMNKLVALSIFAVFALVCEPLVAQNASSSMRNVQVGPRPYFLVNDMEDGALKRKLQSCFEMSLQPTEFSIGHRGAALEFPEHTRESYEAAARMGAGWIMIKRYLVHRCTSRMTDL